MPVAFRSNAWLPDSDNKLKPKVVSASSASGGVRNPRPSWTVSPFSATVASKLVNTTSPFSSPWIADIAAGAVARMSDRIMDCPANVIVIAAGRGACAEPIAHTTPNRTARHAHLLDIFAIPSSPFALHQYTRIQALARSSNHVTPESIFGTYATTSTNALVESPFLHDTTAT